LESLKPHEETIESSTRSLAREIQQEGKVRDPLMVDQADYVILDGMHRFSSLKLLKCRFAPCCLLDYGSDQIKVGAWYRLFVVRNPDGVAKELLNSNGLKYSEQRTTLEDMSCPSHAIIMTRSGNVISLLDNIDSFQRARISVELEKQIVRKGHRVDYQSEITATQKLKSGETDLVIAPPVFTKKEIREYGLQGKLLPHKVTRHIISSRPLHMNVPLSLLMDQEISLPEADAKLDELLKRKSMTVKPPESVVDGRRYDEELLVFT
jgi:hypothetical protein